MKSLLFSLLILTASMNLFAQAHDLHGLVIELDEIIHDNEPKLSHQAEERAAKKVAEAIAILKADLGFGPGSGVQACSQADPQALQQTFVAIKDFAYSGAGLNMNSSGATSYAQAWTNKYPCGYAKTFMTSFKRLKDFAYAGSGLNMNSSGATEYAKANTDKFCSSYSLEQNFKSFYDFAYSGSGLNMNSSGARKYALQKINESDAFTCNNGF